MKVKCKKNVLLFEADENEKIFLVYATSYGHGDSFARFMTSKEISEEGWFDAEEWESDYEDLKIGERTTYLGLGGGHNFITRVN